MSIREVMESYTKLKKDSFERILSTEETIKMYSDTCKLAEAYLSEHKLDDEEEITEEWVKTLPDLSDEPYQGIILSIYYFLKYRITFYYDSKQIEFCWQYGVDYSLRINITKRGQVRQLLKLLEGK